MNKRIGLLFFVFWFAIAGLAAAQERVDHTLWDRLLIQYVNDDGLVDYKGFMSDKPALKEYLDMLAQVKPDELPHSERFAFYINAYNAYTIQLILNHYPVESIKDIGGWFSKPWDIEFVRIDGKTITLDNLEHDILRPQFRDPRVHFAINCASMGCPPLRNEAFVGHRLDQQLDEQTLAQINNPERTWLVGNYLFVNKIFKWFEEDFNDEPEKFVIKYADTPFKKRLMAWGKQIKVKAHPYSWALNQIPSPEHQPPKN